MDDAGLSLGYRPDAFLEAYPDSRCAGVALHPAVEPEPLDTAGAIRFAALDAGIDDTFVVLNGDVLTDFDLGKIRASMTLALRKRPVSVEQIDAAVERIQDRLLNSGAREVTSARLGELVMRELKRIDKVAYVRFASVYRRFEDVDEFRQLIKDI